MQYAKTVDPELMIKTNCRFVVSCMHALIELASTTLYAAMRTAVIKLVDIVNDHEEYSGEQNFIKLLLSGGLRNLGLGRGKSLGISMHQ